MNPRTILTRIYYNSNRLKSIKYLGDKCVKCGEDNIFKLCFHHLLDKENHLSSLLLCKWEKIQKELDKCELLCINCHMEKHYGEKDRNEKKILLEFKGELKCEECGYNKCMAALEFHHINPEDKEFQLSSIMHIKYETIQTLKENIEKELNKCIVLCSNCHKYLHSDIEFFEKNKEIIYSKMIRNHKQSKIDRSEVEKLYKNGMKQIDISKYFNTPRSTISMIIKELKLK
jgi:hypothetical protein